MRKSGWLLCLLLLGTNLAGQQPTSSLLDSVLHELLIAPSDSVLTAHLNRVTRMKRTEKLFNDPTNAHALKTTIFASTQDSALRHRAFIIIATAFSFNIEIDSAIHYQLKGLPWHCSALEAKGYSEEGQVVAILWNMEVVQRWDDILFWTDSLLRHHPDMGTYERQDLYYIKQNALTELGDYVGGLENSRALLNSLDPESEDDNYMRAWAIEQLIRLHRYDKNYTESLRWIDEAIKLSNLDNDTTLQQRLSAKKGRTLVEAGKLYEGRKILLSTLPALALMEQEAQEEYDRGGDDTTFDPVYDYWKIKGSSIPVRVAIVKSFVQEGKLKNVDLQQNLAYLKTQIDNGEEYESFAIKLEMLPTLAKYHSLVGEHAHALAYARENLKIAQSNTKDYSPYVESALRTLHAIEHEAGQQSAAYGTLLKHQAYNEGLTAQIDAIRMTRTAAEINLDEATRGRTAAERATIAEREAAALRSRNFWLALLAAGLIIGVITWAFLRSRKDQQLISSQKEALTESLSEKEVLLREIHHRVKNNLQIISSLLQKQAGLSNDGDAQKLAQEGQERIQSMALIHENLYQSEQLSGVNIRSYLEDLGTNISRSHSKPDADIQLDLAVEDEYLDLDTAIPIGLILNELLTNAYKYAFPEGKSGQIQVVFQRIGDNFELEVNDNGVGLPADHAERSSKSLGHNLVKGLVRQLDGTIEWLKLNEGTGVQIKF